MVKPGDKYNKLTVIECAGVNKWNHRMWRCRCDCGRETVVSSSSLSSLNTKSCGCVQKERRSRFNELGSFCSRRNAAVAHLVIDSFKWRGMLFDLDLTESERKALEKVRETIIQKATETIKQP